MSRVASLEDSRKQGAPGDTALYQFASTAMVFKFTFSGVTFNVAISAGVSGWVPLSVGAEGTAQVQIQAAIDYVENLGGGSVFIDRGLYIMTRIAEAGNDGYCLYIGDYVELCGADWGTELFLAANQITGVNQCHLIKNRTWGVATNSYITIRDMKLNGNEDNQAGAAADFGHGINWWYVDLGRVSNVWITDCEGSGIHHRECDFCLSENNYILDNVGPGIDWGASNYNIARNNRIITTGDDHCIWGNYGSSVGNIIHGNICTGATSNGIMIQGTEANPFLNTIISNNVTFSNGQSGIALGGYAWGTIITGNNSHNNGDRGLIVLVNNEDITATDNNFHDNTQEGCQWYATDSLICNNKFLYNGANFHALNVFGDYNSIHDNIFKGMQNFFFGIEFDNGASYNSAFGNRFLDEGAGGNGRGIKVDGLTEVENVIINNRFYNISLYVFNVGTRTIFEEKWVPVVDDSDAQASISNIGDHFSIMMADDQDCTVRFNFKTPDKLQQLMQAYLEVVSVGANPTLRWGITTDWCECGEAYNAHGDSIATANEDLTQNYKECLDLMGGLSDMTPREDVGVTFNRNGAHVDDDAGDTHILGFVFKFV